MNHPKLPNPNAGLKTPQDLPNADIVIYDGQCVFCRGQVARLQKWDGKDRLAFLSLHDPQTNELCPDLSHDQLMEQMYLVTKDGNRFAGAGAIRYLSRRLPKMWIFAPILNLPFTLPIWQWLYMKVAERRYRIAGKTDDGCESGACEVHFKKK